MTTKRREFLRGALGTAALMATGASARAQTGARPVAAPGGRALTVIDTNVHLFRWPFRRLKYDDPDALVAKLRRHRVEQAWAGSFEALLGKDVDGANARLAYACRRHPGFLVPFGTVNPAWPDWEEDLRRCEEVHRMPGIRLYPAYHGYTLDHPEFARLLRATAERRLLLQVVLELEDTRVHHPTLSAPPVHPAPLVALLREVPAARVQLLDTWLRPPHSAALSALPNLSLEISSLEGVGALDRLLGEPLAGAKNPWPLERVLFGSHAPYFPFEAALLRVFESMLTREQGEAVLRDNAARLLARA